MNDLLLLAMLLDGPKYGYQLKHQAGWIMGRDALHNNFVYPQLRRFLERRWAGKKAVPGERGQTRQRYTLTPEGRRHLFQQLGDFSEADAAQEGAFHLRVGFFSILKRELREAVLGQREKYLQRRDRRLAALEEHEIGKFGREVVKHMRKQVAMECDWIRHLHHMSGSAGPRRRHA